MSTAGIDRPHAHTTRRIDAAADRLVCTKCGRVKPVAAFAVIPSGGRYHSWCKACVRVDGGAYRQTEASRAQRAAYHDRPEVRERRREWARRHAEKLGVKRRAYAATPRGKVLAGRRHARAELLRGPTPERAAVLVRRIALCDAELARLDAQADREFGSGERKRTA